MGEYKNRANDSGSAYDNLINQNVGHTKGDSGLEINVDFGHSDENFMSNGPLN